ncbi:hypothetical protein C2G38_2088323 [Gigaspora rosea]|uniref:Uncharacterized protein n=1 Tax=Gigaspora rosea TaxID=44941 RepID=A0A397V5V0_9GLOM|nr:hypothetical protein C2G38_2088323 [Gigaspora rosea]
MLYLSLQGNFHIFQSYSMFVLGSLVRLYFLDQSLIILSNIRETFHIFLVYNKFFLDVLTRLYFSNQFLVIQTKFPKIL